MRFEEAIRFRRLSRCQAVWTAARIACSIFLLTTRSFGQIEIAILDGTAESPFVDKPTIIQVAPNADFHDQTIQADLSKPLARSSHGPEEIAILAVHNAPLVLLMRGDLQADQKGVVRPSKQELAILNLRCKVQEYRIARQSQLVAAQALELHFGLATLAALEPVQQELEATLTVSLQRQERAIERGLSILDPTALERLLTTAKDSQLQSQSKATQLRSQLSLLVGPSIACNYLPEPMCVPNGLTTEDHCQMIEIALRQRCDLAGLLYLRSHLNDETLEVARWMSDILSGTPSLTRNLALMKPFSLLKLVSANGKTARHDELCSRLSMLDQATKTLREKIASEVDIAMDKRSTAAKRYENTLSQIELWKTRLAQLRAYGDKIKAQPAEELEAEIQFIQAQSDLLQRQGDWHQAVVELALAVGCLQ